MIFYLFSHWYTVRIDFLLIFFFSFTASRWNSDGQAIFPLKVQTLKTNRPITEVGTGF